MKNKYATLIFLIILAFVFFLSLIMMIIYLEKLDYLKDLNNSNSVGIFIYSLVAVGTISLAITTFISLHSSQMKEDKEKERLLNQFNMDHLSDIKENCLSPMLRLITDNYYNYSMFEISEQHKFTDISIQTVIDRPTHSWDKKAIYDVNYRNIISNKSYNDLENHKITKHIPAEFHSVLESIIENYPVYFKNISELFKKIKELKEFEELASRIEQKHKDLPNLKDDYIRLIILLSLNYPDIEYKFCNYFYMSYDDGEYENVKKISNTVKNSYEVKEILSVKNKVELKVKALIKRIDKISDPNTFTLLDECAYLKRQREILLIDINRLK